MSYGISLLGFNGELLDRELGSYHLGNGYRAYNPTIMAFTAPDDLSPFGNGGINPYMYCNGDPINNTDPTGHFNPFGFATGLVLLGVSILSLGMAGIAVASGDLPAAGMALGALYGIYASAAQIGAATSQNKSDIGKDLANFGINLGIIIGGELLGYGAGKLLSFTATKFGPLKEGATSLVEGLFRTTSSSRAVSRIEPEISEIQGTGSLESEEDDVLNLRKKLEAHKVYEPRKLKVRKNISAKSASTAPSEVNFRRKTHAESLKISKANRLATRQARMASFIPEQSTIVKEPILYSIAEEVEEFS